MPSKDTKILGFNQDQKSDKTPSIIYVDLESLIKKVYQCTNNPEKPSTTKKLNIFPVGTQCLQYGHLMELNKKKKQDACRGEDCIKTFCESLREHAAKIFNFERKKIITLRNHEHESYLNLINYHISKQTNKKKVNINTMIKTIVRLKTIVIIQVNTELPHITYVI